MHTLKIEVDDSVFDKVVMFLKQLPSNKVTIKEETSTSAIHSDFIAYLTSNPIKVHEPFLSRTESNVR